jgi:mannose-6-phosphate isomerase-like protein (cupin superfamily)
MTIVRDLSARSVAAWPTVDLAHVSEEPASPIQPFEFHGCYWAAASFKGSPPWELHTTGDELLYILAGSTSLTVRGPEGETLHNLRTGDLVVVPKGCWHRNDAPEGVTMLFHDAARGQPAQVGRPRSRRHRLPGFVAGVHVCRSADHCGAASRSARRSIG